MRTLVITTCAFLTCCGLTFAGEWHHDNTLLCQDCHLQHSTEQGQPIPGGPYSTLLLKSSVNELCLMCHDGTDPTAPDVQTPVQMYQSTTSGESAGGWFSAHGYENHAGHDLGMPTVTPLSGTGALIELNCAHCHAVHGNENYRNLAHDPAGVGDSILMIDGNDIFTDLPPGNPPTTAATIAAYERDNVGYRQNYAAWCASCHDLLANTAGALPPAHFNEHPSDVALDAYPFDAHTDPAHWISGIGDGFPVSGDLDNSGIPRVPFESPNAIDYTTAREPNASNEVTCVSCHAPHGGAYTNSMRWPYQEGGQSFLAGCQQCHNM